MDFVIRRRLEAIKGGEVLTDAEVLTVEMLGRMDSFALQPWARALHIHVNSLKYRLACIGRKWGMDDPTPTHVAQKAIGMGYGGREAMCETLAAFEARLEQRLPTGYLQPLSDGLRLWLRDELATFIRERRLKDAERAA